MALSLRSSKDIKRITVKLDDENHSISKYIPSDLIGLSVQLIPAILYLQFLSLPIHTPSVLI
jgi:hypothetical protein